MCVCVCRYENTHTLYATKLLQPIHYGFRSSTICMYICMYVHMYRHNSTRHVYMYVCTYIHMYTHNSTRHPQPTHMYEHTFVCMYTCTRTRCQASAANTSALSARAPYVWIYIRMYVYIHTHTLPGLLSRLSCGFSNGTICMNIHSYVCIHAHAHATRAPQQTQPRV
jgi:hypothetical protein